MKPLRLLACLLAAAVLAATRAGSGGLWPLLGVAAAALYGVVAAMAILRPTGRSRGVAVLAGGAALAFPVSPAPVLPLPAALAALLVVGSFLAVAPAPGSEAPLLGRPSRSASAGPWVRLAAWLAVPFVFAVAWSAFGPDRLASLSETPVLAPVLAAALAALVALAIQWAVPRRGES